ncbi:MAG TPA: PQQ-binding-like beta-propeller repeat protein, partial [Fimbriimonas sp.]|nr:PQQ-binding-like beta-propeller repeat protein [Fimbriimonas sp.]
MGGFLLSLALVASQGANVDWQNVGNDKGGMRYSTLSQINRNTVKQLKPAWTYHTGDAEKAGTTIECTPIVIDGVMYITTVKLKVVALNAATGKPIWDYDTKAKGVNRGVAYWSNGSKKRIIAATPDGKMVSLDAKTGERDASFGNNGIVELRDGIERDISSQQYGSTSAPAIFENLIIVPIICSEGQPGAPGDIRAFDVETGKPVWRFRTVPQPGEFGNETWTNGGWKDRSGTN